jgi:O-succinylbenzoic acid--CoA ligase
MDELSILAAAQEVPAWDCLVIGRRTLSYAEVAERVGGAISLLQARGVESGQRVALVPDVDLDSVLWLYALFELGCPAVLVHPRLTSREREQILAQSRPVHLIDAPVPSSPTISSSSARVRVPSDRTLAIVYTSGTRGQPRGAKLSRRAFVASEAAHAANLGWQVGDRWLLCMPPAHVGGLSIVTRSLIARRCAVLSPGPFDPRLNVEVMKRARVTLASVVPTMLGRLLSCEDPVWTPNPELRTVLVGGAPFSARLRALAAERGVVALATYGCTEACSQVTTQNSDQAGKPGCGAPLRGIGVRIEQGEIQIRGDVLMDGYLEEESATSVWSPDGWLRTGDSGVWLPDGQLCVQGRMDDLIVTGAENVAPQEVEAWLETVPGVIAACVFPVPDDEWGQQVMAAIVAEPPELDLVSLRDRLQRELAPHKRPKKLCLVESFPLNRSGKVDRDEVAKRCAAQLFPI